MPSSGSSGNWTLPEFLGQKRLLGLGALLTWLILFHLLVNVWLLCIFTSLLVVLGGWLGSRAALDANSFLHLEHFLPLGKVCPPQDTLEHERRLNHEIHSAVHKAVRDFVSSWYRTLLPEVEGEFERAVCNSMLESVMELKERAQRVDRKALVEQLLELYGCHLQSYMTVRQIQSAQKENITLWQLYSEVDSPHPAVSNATAELNYSRALVNLVLHVLVPYPQMETKTGGYMVTELITCNVLLPLINRISDPDWLNQTIVDIFTKSREPQEFDVGTIYSGQIQHETWTTCESLSAYNQATFSNTSSSEAEDLQSQSTVSGTDSSRSSMDSLSCAGKTPSCHTGLNTPNRVNCCTLTSGHYPQSSGSKVVSMDSLIQSNSRNDMRGVFCDCGPTANLCHLLPVNHEEVSGCFGSLRTLGPKAVVPEESLWLAGITQEKSPASSRRKLCLNSFNFDFSNSPAACVNIQNVYISGTVNVKEQRSNSSHSYTLYTVKFETVADGDDTDTGRPSVHHTVNRRYSEFLNLQTRLEERPDFKKLIKNVKSPKKIFPELSFGSPDSEKVEARKSQLNVFLKQLSSIPDIVSCEDMHEFLAMNSGDCTYFERKPLTKSRIDKMVENALGTLRTAFPHPELLSPVEDVDGDNDGRIMDYRKYRKLFPSKMSTSLNMTDLHPKVSYCFSEGSAVLNGMSLSGLETFVREQEVGLIGTGRAMRSCETQGKDRKMAGRSHGTDTAVADAALNVLCLLMKDQWSWLCTENIQKAIRLLFGTFIEHWLDVGAARLTSAPCWVIYLQVLQETVWPGGTLPAHPRPERSAAEKEETKERCLDCLMQLLPELIADMLGSEKYRLSLETMLASLQDHQINKHLIYCVCDLLLEFLIPESSDEAFQTSLLQSLTKDTERDSPHT
ncbi:sorting nexin-19a [Nematolebias whitei]|uniref:sorting nexin-19a n=1 Tax=Nematolebias whitei TaxID=451745 RepID=UPI001897E1F2|nr:sorting nexin-19a [Nematolebias whitei]